MFWKLQINLTLFLLSPFLILIDLKLSETNLSPPSQSRFSGDLSQLDLAFSVTLNLYSEKTNPFSLLCNRRLQCGAVTRCGTSAGSSGATSDGGAIEGCGC
ncbi:unnamed protein product [Arabidopsis thaliana]|uniref:Transmembrane protein n=1 Tax=Arabidopsis thaliana TaxID=3702 RepID=A0A5S9WXP0_ARATH|nr:unnamed protein product [Arabidopsis thaliana]